jgi:hypothetical protein
MRCGKEQADYQTMHLTRNLFGVYIRTCDYSYICKGCWINPPEHFDDIEVIRRVIARAPCGHPVHPFWE